MSKVESIEAEKGGSLEGGADKREVRMGSACTLATSGECKGVLSRSFGDKESILSMPLSCSNAPTK